jgi:hypothetical protein
MLQLYGKIKSGKLVCQFFAIYFILAFQKKKKEVESL